MVLPYFCGMEEEPVAAKILELSGFKEAIGAWPSGIPWVPELLPYAYLTHANPGTVAAVVGPFAEVRLFANGKLIAFRDGKGWATLHEKVAAPAGLDAVVGHLLDVAVQISPYARPGSHGGLLAYDPLATADTWADAREQKLVAALSNWEPATQEADGLWLTGRSLLEPTQDGKLVMDPEVMGRLIRASALDGAILLDGEHCRVAHFAQQLLYPPPSAAKSHSGTKQGAALGFVSPAGNDARHAQRCAVIVSSDGPVGIAFAGDTEVREVFSRIKARD